MPEPFGDERNELFRPDERLEGVGRWIKSHPVQFTEGVDDATRLKI